jgi:hypothetical protein
LGGPSLAWILRDGFSDASHTQQVTRQTETRFKRMKEPRKTLLYSKIRMKAACVFTLSLTKSVTDLRHWQVLVSVTVPKRVESWNEA